MSAVQFTQSRICNKCGHQIQISKGERWLSFAGKIYHELCGLQVQHNIDHVQADALLAVMNMPEEELRKILEECILDENPGPGRRLSNKIAVPFLLSRLQKRDMVDCLIHLRKTTDAMMESKGNVQVIEGGKKNEETNEGPAVGGDRGGHEPVEAVRRSETDQDLEGHQD